MGLNAEQGANETMRQAFTDAANKRDQMQSTTEPQPGPAPDAASTQYDYHIHRPTNNNKQDTTQAGRVGGGSRFFERFARPMRRNSGDERANKFKDAVYKMLQEGDRKTTLANIHVGLLDAPEVPRSVVLIYLDDGDQVVVHPIIIGTKEALPEDVRNTQGYGFNAHNVQTRIPKVESDLSDALLIRKITSRVASIYSDRSPNISVLGSTVFSGHFTEADDVHVVANILSYSTDVLWARLDEIRNNVTSIVTGQDLSKTGGATVRMEIDKQHGLYADGRPCRSDIRIIQSVRTDDNVNQQNQHQQPFQQMGQIETRPITTCTGFINLVYLTQQQNQQFGQFNQFGMPQQQFFYVPQFVITKNDCEMANTLETQLLTLYSANLVNQQIGGTPLWHHAMRPQMTQDGQIDYSDVGALGLEVQFRDPTTNELLPLQRQDKNADGWKDYGFSRMLSGLVHPNAFICMDIDEGGELMPVQTLFTNAALGVPDASTAIVAAANNLTNGAFQMHFDKLNGTQNGMVCYPESVRVHMGHYRAADGSYRDIRDIDYLTALNLVGDENRSMVHDFCSTYDHLAIDERIRLDRRTRLITYFNSGAVFTGYARRIIFTPQFINALAAGLMDVGYVAHPEANNQVGGFSNQVVGNSFMGGYAAANTGFNMFASAAPQMATAQNYNMMPGAIMPTYF